MFRNIFCASTKIGDCKNVNNSINILNLTSMSIATTVFNYFNAVDVQVLVMAIMLIYSVL